MNDQKQNPAPEQDISTREELSEEELERTTGGSVPVGLYDSERRAEGKPPAFF